MDLSTGTLSWLETIPSPPSYPTLTEDLSCDVLVIGAGEAGSLCTYMLTEKGVKVVVVDKRSVGRGSTSANTGLLQFASDKTLTSCINTLGKEEGVRYYTLSLEAVKSIGTICSKLAFDPQFIPRESLYYASSEEDIPALKQEYETLKKYGFEVSYWDTEKIQKHYSFAKPGAIFSSGDAEINPYRFAHALIYTSHQNGAKVYEHTEIQRHTADKGGITFFTKDNKKIRAKKAIIAAGYEAQEIKKNPNAVLASSYAIATQPFEDFSGWHNRSLVWETARPYLYIRTTADNRIIVGGEDEPTNITAERDAMLLNKKEVLLNKLHELFPEYKDAKADYFWSATFGGTHDGLPLIGEQEEFPHCYFPLGYGGNGTVYSTIAAEILSEIIVNGSHPDADLFKFNRNPKASGV
ncbi:MAG TPA: FAD-dependent oxidoreductase [Chondromyces sp.]|nr:FAD-dependent oxidoreductase [Chondromyces sp.]